MTLLEIIDEYIDTSSHELNRIEDLILDSAKSDISHKDLMELITWRRYCSRKIRDAMEYRNEITNREKN